ncbi:MAG: hypothetical protein AAF974_01820 [Cyanobacteria bacterium P01_E01_bin.34]
MDYRTIEGTWEEVLEHSDELAGHHVKVIVLQEESKPQTLAEALKGKIGLLEFDVPEDLHQRTGEVLTDILDDKQRT